MLSRLTCVAFLLVFLAGCGASNVTVEQEDTAPKPDAIAQRIDYAISLLEAKKSLEFIESFMEPNALQEVKDLGELDNLAKNLPFDKVIALFKSIKEVEPIMSEDGKTAIFEVDNEITGTPTFEFVNMDGTWYLAVKKTSSKRTLSEEAAKGD